MKFDTIVEKYLKTLPDLSGYKDLGWINSWFGTNKEPKEFTQCRKKGHEEKGECDTYQVSPGATRSTVICPKCKIYYKVDSGD